MPALGIATNQRYAVGANAETKTRNSCWNNRKPSV